MLYDGKEEVRPQVSPGATEVLHGVSDHLAANAVADQGDLAVRGHVVFKEPDLVLGLTGQAVERLVT